MKKTLYLISLLVCIIFLGGCSGKSTNNTISTPSQPITPISQVSSNTSSEKSSEELPIEDRMNALYEDSEDSNSNVEKEETPVLTPVKTNNENTIVYVGSKNSDKYHYPSCSAARKIKEYNKVTFSSKQDAINSGYVACKICKP